MREIGHSVLLPAQTATTTQTGAATDLSAYASDGKREFKVVLDNGTITGTQGTLDVKLQECATTNGTFTDISGATFTQRTTTTGSEAIYFQTTKQYVKAVATTGGTSPSFAYSVVLYGIKRVV